jgi:hypothetical protein
MNVPTAARVSACIALGVLVAFTAPVRAAVPSPGPPLTIRKAAGPIVIDGDVTDPGWQGIEPITHWYETNVGDNVEPQVKNVAYLTYDDHYFYAAFVFEDPNPKGIRAPLGDHDAVPSSTDYAGVIIDCHNDGKTAQMFLSNPAGVQYDAISSDVSGEDNSPDFYWDSQGKITATGWTLEIRIPFSTLRYGDAKAPTFGVLLYRNYPRDRRYQFFSARLPRDVNCFICNSSKMNGLANLPQGSHLVVAPFATGSQTAEPEAGLGTPLKGQSFDSKAGLDAKWNPGANAAIDLTLNPDFSQIESDVAQIGANERFALFYPEKRPFFLEGIDLFSTPFQAVYTRTITEPNAGGRATGRFGSTSYTALVTQDVGGGRVILPGPEGSGAAPQDFISDVGILRVRRDFGPSFVSVMGNGRLIHGGGYNTVFGPDFQWRPKPSDNVTGQYLLSYSETPNRPDLTAEWDGRKLSSGAGLLYWSHGTPHEDWFVQYQNLGTDFRADQGFIPQVGYSEIFLDGGYTIRPKKGFVSRWRMFTTDWYDREPNGDLLSRRVSLGSGFDGRLNSFIRIELNSDAIRSQGEVFERFRPRLVVQTAPGRVINQINVDAQFGDEIDFANARTGHGPSLVTSATVRPSDHLTLSLAWSYRALNVDDPNLGSGRLFTAQVERLRAVYAFNARSFVRLIGQYVQTTSNPALYLFPVDPKTATFSGSGLVAYKLNWQTVMYVGYGSEHDYMTATDRLEPAMRQFFAKLSYAWQR